VRCWDNGLRGNQIKDLMTYQKNEQTVVRGTRGGRIVRGKEERGGKKSLRKLVPGRGPQ